MINNEHAMSISDIAFGLFALFLIISGIIYVAVLTIQQPPISDTYGNQFTNITNSSQSSATNLTAIEERSSIPILLLASAVFICAVIFVAWVVSKSGIHL